MSEHYLMCFGGSEKESVARTIEHTNRWDIAEWQSQSHYVVIPLKRLAQ
jgi:hypothetical protein